MPISREDFVSFVNANSLGVLATSALDGRPEAALVGFIATADGHLIVPVSEEARKVANLAADGRVAVVVGVQEPTSLQIEGTARTAADEVELEAWKQAYLAIFPKSKISGPGMVVYRITAEWIRRYEVTSQGPQIDEGPVDFARAERA